MVGWSPQRGMVGRSCRCPLRPAGHNSVSARPREARLFLRSRREHPHRTTGWSSGGRHDRPGAAATLPNPKVISALRPARVAECRWRSRTASSDPAARWTSRSVKGVVELEHRPGCRHGASISTWSSTSRISATNFENWPSGIDHPPAPGRRRHTHLANVDDPEAHLPERTPMRRRRFPLRNGHAGT